MKRLQEISLEKTLSVEVKCSVNESAIDKNFQVILECLKALDNSQNAVRDDLSHTNQRTEKCQKDIQKLLRQVATITSKMDNLRESPSKMRLSAATNQKQANVQPQGEIDAGDIEALRRRIEEDAELNKKNNIENLKDINLLLKDVKDLKRRLDEVDGRVGFTVGDSQSGGRPATESDTGHTLEHTRVMQNEMQRQLDLINKLYAELDALKTAQEKNESRVNQLEAEKGNSGANTVSVGGSGSGPDSNSLQANLDKYNHGLERLEIIEQKLRLIPNSNDYESSMSELRTWIGEVEETVTILQEEIEAIKTKKTIDGQYKPENTPRTNEPSTRRQKQSDLQHQSQHKWLRETVKDAVARIEDLEKMMTSSREKMEVLSIKQIEGGSKGDHGKSDGKDKLLPSINKRQLKLKRDSHNNTQIRDTGSKQHSSILKEGVQSAKTGHRNYDFDRKLLDIKSQLQQWLKQLLEARNLGANPKKEDEQYKQLELRIQEIRMGLERKADHEGMRKYLTFLQNKINQLFMILAQPQSQDALIARKGWGCLSCAKKLEKYKGRLGEHLNWNNFTHNNYSPPKIGSAQTQQNLRSVEKTKLGNSNDRSFAYDDQHHGDI